jgi:two-component system, OmpR family, response regulator
MLRILLIEDDTRISDFVVKGLEENGYSVSLASSGEEARDMVSEGTWDIILMDIMLPGIDGIQLTKLIRYKKNHTPILALSALGGPEDKVNALDSGADDYLTKPFHFKELLARINAMARRTKYNYQTKTEFFTCADLTVNIDEHQIKRGDKELSLSSRELKLLLYLLENKNRTVSRTQILNAVWGIDYDTNTNVVDVYISYLRNKIDGHQEKKLIHTIKGSGYSIRE